jgi:hypothetical protein
MRFDGRRLASPRAARSRRRVKDYGAADRKRFAWPSGFPERPVRIPQPCRRPDARARSATARSDVRPQSGWLGNWGEVIGGTGGSNEGGVEQAGENRRPDEPLKRGDGIVALRDGASQVGGGCVLRSPEAACFQRYLRRSHESLPNNQAPPSRNLTLVFGQPTVLVRG